MQIHYSMILNFPVGISLRRLEMQCSCGSILQNSKDVPADTLELRTVSLHKDPSNETS